MPVSGFEVTQTTLPGMSDELPLTKVVKSVTSCSDRAVVCRLEMTITLLERSALVAMAATQAEMVLQLTPSAPSRLPLLLANFAPGLSAPPNSTTRRRSGWV